MKIDFKKIGLLLVVWLTCALLVFLSFKCRAQGNIPPQQVGSNYQFKSAGADSGGLRIPKYATLPATPQSNYVRSGALAWRTTDKSLWAWDTVTNAWLLLTVSGMNGVQDSAGILSLGQDTSNHTTTIKLGGGRQVLLNGKIFYLVDSSDYRVNSSVSFNDSSFISMNAKVSGGPLWQVRPSNYGITYPSAYYPGGFTTSGLWSSGWAANTSLDNAPDNVYQAWAYNMDYSGNRRTNLAPAMRSALETWYINTIGGVHANMEYHDPEMILANGHRFRPNTWYINIDNGVGLHQKWIDNEEFHSEQYEGSQDLWLQARSNADGGGVYGEILLWGGAVGSDAHDGVIRFVDNTFGDRYKIQTISGQFWAGPPGNSERTVLVLPNGDVSLGNSLSLNPSNWAGVHIGMDSTQAIHPNASAVLDVQSDRKGFLPPRLTTTQKNAIPSPARGLMVYDTTADQMSYWNGTLWINF